MSSEAAVEHAEAERLVRTAWRAGRLPHALLLTGESGIGKRRFADWIVRLRWCDREQGPCGECAACRKVASGNHPDLEIVRRDPDAADGHGSRHEITVDQIRLGVRPWLSLRSVEGRGRAVIVEEADLMNEEAQNAFLKTLEEPPAGSLLVLVTAREEALVDTVRSRCQEVRLFPQVGEELGQDLAQRLARGRPGRAAELATLDLDGLLEAFDALLTGRLSGVAFAREARRVAEHEVEPGQEAVRRSLVLEVLHTRPAGPDPVPGRGRAGPVAHPSPDASGWGCRPPKPSAGRRKPSWRPTWTCVDTCRQNWPGSVWAMH